MLLFIGGSFYTYDTISDRHLYKHGKSWDTCTGNYCPKPHSPNRVLTRAEGAGWVRTSNSHPVGASRASRLRIRAPPL